MSKVSIFIPAHTSEPYIRETVGEVCTKATGEIEVLLIIDGPKPKYRLPRRKNVKVLHNKKTIGLRQCTNQASEVATGEYFAKIDAHCMLGMGWDEILKADCADNWIVVPERYMLDVDNWEPYGDGISAMSYMYPRRNAYRPRLTGRPDKLRQERQEGDLVEDMTFQGSFWLMKRKHFVDRLYPLDENLYGDFSEEPQSIGLPTQLGKWHGKIMRNKKTWYAHWAKPGNVWRSLYNINELHSVHARVFDYWWYNRWPDKALDFQVLVDRFWPIRRWPENWRWEMEQFNRYSMDELICQ